ncbi:MAG: DegV family protein [Syntrophomonadaceae bacterium]
MGIKIVSDNCCDLPDQLLHKYNIQLACLPVRFGNRQYEYGGISNDEFYKMMATSPELPKTSQPSVDNFINIYSQSLEDGSEVIALHMSSALSGTLQGAQIAASMLDNPRLHVVDTRKASTGQGLIVLKAAQMAAEGASLTDIMNRINDMQKRIQCVFTVANLEYLVRGGRLSKTKGLVADIIDVKPILHVDDDGFIKAYDKARGHKGAMKKLLDIMDRIGKELSAQTVGICHAASPHDAQYLKDEIFHRWGSKEIIIGEIGPVIGSHVGPGTCGVFFEK